MQVTKITVDNGEPFYTNDPDGAARFFGKLKAPWSATVELIEMTPEEYQAIPATNESAALFA